VSVILSKDIKAKVARATVKLSTLGGQGVLVNGNLILTAAHCIHYVMTGGTTLGEWEDILNPIETNDGSRFLVQTYAVEVVADIAVLGCPDDQEVSEAAEAFEIFCENTSPLQICCREFELSQPSPIFIYDHKEKWIAGTAKQYRENAPFLHIIPDQKIEGGTSGSPVVNGIGELLGVVSSSGETVSLDGSIWRPHLALPVRIVQEILNRKGGA